MLILAAYTGNLDIVKLLCVKGAKLDAKDNVSEVYMNYLGELLIAILCNALIIRKTSVLSAGLRRRNTWRWSSTSRHTLQR